MIASLHEDQYGVAQGDIPKVLEAFIQYLSTLEGYAAELNRAADDGKYPAAIVRAQVSESVQPTIDGESLTRLPYYGLCTLKLLILRR